MSPCSLDEIRLHGDVILVVPDTENPLPSTPYGELLTEEHSQVNLVRSAKEMEARLNDDVCALVFAAEILDTGVVERDVIRSWFDDGLLLEWSTRPIRPWLDEIGEDHALTRQRVSTRCLHVERLRPPGGHRRRSFPLLARM